MQSFGSHQHRLGKYIQLEKEFQISKASVEKYMNFHIDVINKENIFLLIFDLA